MAILMLHAEGVIGPADHTNMVYAEAIHGSFEENLESYMFLWRTLQQLNEWTIYIYYVGRAPKKKLLKDMNTMMPSEYKML